MARIRFETGQVVNFDGNPTQADVEEVAQRLGISKAQPGAPTTQPQPLEREGVGGALGVATGFAKGVGGLGAGVGGLLQGLGQRTLAGVLPGVSLEDVRGKTGIKALQRGTEQAETLQEALKARGGAEKIGKGIETVAEFAVPTTKIARLPKVVGAAKATGRGVKQVPGKAFEVGVGTAEKRAAVAGLRSPEIQRKVIRGEITTETLAEKAGKLFTSSQAKSRAKLTKSREAIAGTSKRADVSKSITQLLKKERTERILLREEEFLIKKLETFLKRSFKGGGTITKREIDDLVRSIDDAGFFRKGAASDKFRSSNKIITSVRQLLRSETIKGNPKFEALLKTASKKDIPFFKRLGVKVLDKEGNVDLDKVQTAINQVVRNLNDPNKKQGAIKLLEELAERAKDKSGFLNEINVFSASLPLLKDVAGATNIFRAASQRVGRGAAAGARALGSRPGRLGK